MNRFVANGKMTVTLSGKNVDAIKNENVKKMKLCKKNKVLEAISVLKQLNEKFLSDGSKKQSLLEEATESPVFLQITLKKIPSKQLIQMIKVLLPHPLVTDTSEVCLFTGDTDKSNRKAEIEPDVLHFKELLREHGVSKVTEVITLRQLRTEYKVYEAKRQLMAAYDVFLADKKIAQCLPRILGKVFFKKRKFPIQINMKTSNLKAQIERALSTTVFDITCRGNTCTSTVARLDMEDKEILENIQASLKILVDKLPGAQNNISGIFIKTAKSQGIPIYLSFDNPNEVKIQNPYKPEFVEAEELSTLPNASVKVFKDGKIKVEKHFDSDEEGNSDDLEPKKIGKMKKRDIEIKEGTVKKDGVKKATKRKLEVAHDKEEYSSLSKKKRNKTNGNIVTNTEVSPRKIKKKKAQKKQM